MSHKACDKRHTTQFGKRRGTTLVLRQCTFHGSAVSGQSIVLFAVFRTNQSLESGIKDWFVKR